jgi:O-antigen biosynthesis protein
MVIKSADKMEKRKFFMSSIRKVLTLLCDGVSSLLKDRPGIFLQKLSGKLSHLFHRFKFRLLIPETSDYLDAYLGYLDASRGQDRAFYVPESDDEILESGLPLKVIAFYLPQFHPIPENDKWWGKGFTEWTNVSKAVPQFGGHYQPRLPGELGFYDLRIPEVQKRQVELARKYGIHGFAFYYYWFNGRRLLEKPIDAFFADKENNFPFCIFWANENWTRRWDGKEEDILIAQNHSPENDLAFIKDIEPYLRDARYIHIDGRPVILVYRVKLFPNPLETAKRWREYCREAGIGEIYLIAGQVYGFEDPGPVGFDAALEFPPHNIILKRINQQMKILNPAYEGHIFNYEDFARVYSEKTMPQYELFKTVSPGWDNEPRKPGKGFSISQATPQLYQQWLEKAGTQTMEKEPWKRFIFLNAWNEWAEGAYLEPDRRFGYAYLQATKDALYNLAASFSGSNQNHEKN